MAETDQDRTSQEIQQKMSRQQLDFVFQNMEDAVCVTGKSGVLQYMNEAAGKLFGILPGEAAGQKIWKLIPYVERNDMLIQLFIDAVTAGERNHQGIVDYEKNSGEVCRLRVNVTYTKAEAEMFVIVITNLTELTKVNAAFARYTSADIAEYVLRSPEGEKQGGAEKNVTILMSDLRGFTAMSGSMTPDRLIRLLNHYFEKMVEVITRYAGTVIEFLGDGIFVVFGAPKDDPDHALHAVCCAVEMQNAMEAVNAWGAEEGYPSLEMGIGINSGPAVVGNIGSDRKMKYGCMGQTVNLAGRTESYTVGGQIYVTERTKALLKVQPEVTEEQSFLPKGGKSHMSIFSIEGVEGIVSLHEARRQIDWRDLPAPVPVAFYELDGKLVEDEACRGTFLKLSADGRYGLLHSEIPLARNMNIMIDIGGYLYAKVTGRLTGEHILCFTAKPEGFDRWRNEKMKR